MNELIYNKLKAEYETTDISYEDLFSKYSIDKAKVKNYKSWTKNLLSPRKYKEKVKHLNTHMDIVAANIDKVEVDDTLVLVPDKDSTKKFEPLIAKEIMEKDEIELIHKASQEIISTGTATLTKELKDGFDGLRRLDKLMQDQAVTLVETIGTAITTVDTENTKGVLDLVKAHTTLRDTYFNSKNTMVNIINGDVNNTSTTNNLAQILNEVEDDC